MTIPESIVSGEQTAHKIFLDGWLGAYDSVFMDFCYDEISKNMGDDLLNKYLLWLVYWLLGLKTVSGLNFKVFIIIINMVAQKL